MKVFVDSHEARKINQRSASKQMSTRCTNGGGAWVEASKYLSFNE
jgi:hypothetical protein